MKQKKINAEFLIEAKIPFYSYNSEKLNEKAIKKIKQEVLNILKAQTHFVEFSVEEDHDDWTCPGKFKIVKGSKK